ncbi:site-specific DNA recombinase, partial [Constrictibacter sp. MBR-5]
PVGSLINVTSRGSFLNADTPAKGVKLARRNTGRSGGGLCYGYDVVSTAEPGRGERAINPAEAAIVQRIYRQFAAGMSPRAIAKDLNEAGIPGPRGTTWMDTAIRGHVSRGTGILNNELYIGRLVWNRLRYMKDPSTGKRVSRQNPASQWIIQDVPDLRIVDDALWQAVKERQTQIAETFEPAITGIRAARNNRLNAAHRPKSLLAGLIVCGTCGSAYTSLQRGRLGCPAHYRRGTCDNGRTVLRTAIETRVLDGLKQKLLAPDKIAAAVRAFYEETNRLNRDATAAATEDRRTLQQTEKKLSEIVAAIENGGFSQTLMARLKDLEARKVQLEARIAQAPAALPPILPNVAELYAAKVANLVEALTDPEAMLEAGDVIRSLVAKVVLTPGAKRGEVHAELHGELAAILALASAQKKSLTPVSRGVRLSVVAGAGFEPATFRL